MTQQYTPQEMTALEGGGYLYCYPCQEWEDDAYCFGDDHSRHCGHRLKVPGEFSTNMAIQCSGRVGKLRSGRRKRR